MSDSPRSGIELPGQLKKDYTLAAGLNFLLFFLIFGIIVAGTNAYTVPCQPDLIFDGFGFMAFFVMQSTQNFPSRANLGKIGSQLRW